MSKEIYPVVIIFCLTMNCKIVYSTYCVTGGVDTHRSANDFDYSSPRDSPDTTIWDHARQSKDVAVARQGRATRRQRLLYVSSEHKPHDQSSWILTGGR